MNYVKNPVLWVGIAIGWLAIPQVRKYIGR